MQGTTERFTSLIEELSKPKTNSYAIDECYSQAAEFYEKNWGDFFRETKDETQEINRAHNQAFWQAIASSLQSANTDPEHIKVEIGFTYFSAYTKFFLSDNFTLGRKYTRRNSNRHLPPLFDSLPKQEEKAIVTALSQLREKVIISKDPNCKLYRTGLYQDLLSRDAELRILPKPPSPDEMSEAPNGTFSQFSTNGYLNEYTSSRVLKHIVSLTNACLPIKELKQATKSTQYYIKETETHDLFNHSSWFWNIILLPKRILIDIPVLKLTSWLKSHNKKDNFLNNLQDFLAFALLLLFSPEELTKEEKYKSSSKSIRTTHLVFWIGIGVLLPFCCSATYGNLLRGFLGGAWQSFAQFSADLGIAAPISCSVLLFTSISLICNTLPWFSKKITTYSDSSAQTCAKSESGHTTYQDLLTATPPRTPTHQTPELSHTSITTTKTPSFSYTDPRSALKINLPQTRNSHIVELSDDDTDTATPANAFSYTRPAASINGATLH